MPSDLHYGKWKIRPTLETHKELMKIMDLCSSKAFPITETELPE